MACARDFDAPFRDTDRQDREDGGTSTTTPPRDSGTTTQVPRLDSGTPSPPEPDSGAPPRCTLDEPFGELNGVALNSADEEASARLTADELTMYYASDRDGGRFRIWSAKRATTNDPWSGASATLVADDPTSILVDPAVAPDGLSAFFQKTPLDNSGAKVITGSRASTAVPFGNFQVLTELDVANVDEGDPYLNADGSLAFARNSDLFLAKKGGDGKFAATAIPGIDAAPTDRDPVLSSDGLEIYFSRRDPGVYRTFRATRSEATAPFGPAAIVAELATGAGSYEAPTWLSADRCVLYFASNRVGPKSDIHWVIRGLRRP